MTNSPVLGFGSRKQSLTLIAQSLIAQSLIDAKDDYWLQNLVLSINSIITMLATPEPSCSFLIQALRFKVIGCRNMSVPFNKKTNVCDAEKHHQLVSSVVHNTGGGSECE